MSDQPLHSVPEAGPFTPEQTAALARAYRLLRLARRQHEAPTVDESEEQTRSTLLPEHKPEGTKKPS